MTKEFDPKRSYLSIKAHEKMTAFVSFLLQRENHDISKDGVIKISTFHRPYGGGHLTLTFIIDTEGDESLKYKLNEIFKTLTDESIRPKLGKSFEKIVKVSLDSLAHIRDWYVEEVNIYFRSLEERENVLIEKKLIPALESILPFSFDAVDWWPENLAPRSLIGHEIAKHSSLKSLFKKWFGLE
ncbi:MAG: hypothetical protein JSV31_20255 [Desulfobacterales bacterium]|nr:MAG: hypothetical protein JSV31_20255 [Desulfobacterales bacterium]